MYKETDNMDIAITENTTPNIINIFFFFLKMFPPNFAIVKYFFIRTLYNSTFNLLNCGKTHTLLLFFK